MTGRRIALVGAYGQIGSAIARRTTEEDTLFLLGRDMAKLEALAAELDATLGTASADARDPEQLRSAFEGHTDIEALLLPLGGSAGSGAFSELEHSEIETAFSAKLFAQMHVVQAALPHLAESAVIVLFSGVLSRLPVAGNAAMAAVNGAIESLTRTLSVELAPHRVVCLSPAMVASNDERGPDDTTADEVAAVALGLIDMPISGMTIDIPRSAAAIGRAG